MDYTAANITTREGPRKGESLGALESRRIGPDVYGGANRREEDVLGLGGKFWAKKGVGEKRGESSRRETGTRNGAEEVASESDSSLRPVGSRLGSRSGSPVIVPMGGAKRPRLSEGEENNMSTDEERPGTPVPVRRIGQVPDSGRFRSSLGRTREARQQTRLRAEEDLLKETEVARCRRVLRKGVGSTDGQRIDEKTAARLQNEVLEDVEIIKKVATKSSNLKGTFVRDLKDAADSIKAAVEVLASRNISEETRKLQADNVRLQAEMASLRTELSQLRQEMKGEQNQGSVPPPMDVTEEAPPVTQPPSKNNGKNNKTKRSGPTSDALTLEEICRTVMIQVGGMLDARLATFEDRLLPARNLRPPLASDNRQVGRNYAAVVSGSASDASRPAEGNVPQTSAQPGPSTAQRPVGSNRTQGAKEGTSTSTSTPSKGVQEKKKKRKKKKKYKKKDGHLPATNQEQRQSQMSASEWTKVGRKQQLDPKSRASKLRPPGCAVSGSAVLLTLKPGVEESGTTYAKVITFAKEKINAADIGAHGVRLRKAATGGRLFEFPGASSADKADLLANKLREVLGDDFVTVSRPIKSVDLRVTGLDDSVTSAEVIAAVASVGGCPADQVRAGVVVSGYDGLGAVLVHCPVAAAKKIVAGGRLLVGWVSAQVKLLDARPLMCYRCLAPGHVGVQCKEGIDRSGLCYRCGQPGHKSRGCSAAPYCVVCAAAGKSAEHRVGGRICLSTSNKKKRGGNIDLRSKQSSSLPQQTVGPEEVPMTED
ncbi:uncharacterized protein LOC112047623 [Bicyclus anynana]|uniref:Uncharacterized protein LOC112047623 n=1 Tax=Bicyclus anynana TaxID=110368 RepID=A0A6J1NBZ4_BICAN|nr:uncharacterized protein LOC112047623 [Bicyclus anynana]